MNFPSSSIGCEDKRKANDIACSQVIASPASLLDFIVSFGTLTIIHDSLLLALFNFPLPTSAFCSLLPTSTFPPAPSSLLFPLPRLPSNAISSTSAYTNNTIDNQRPNWPPAPTVEDEVPGEQTTPTPMPGAQNNAHAQTPVNDNTTTPAPNDDAAPHTPANGNAAAAPAADRVQIVLKDQGGTQVAFGVKSNTRMEKVMNAYAERSARPVGTLRFHFDGERVLPDDTTASVSPSFDRISRNLVLTTIFSSIWKRVISSRS